ncbi:tryptophan halogenase [Fischerella sp. JS2]|uniref:NAD(P)/FAD-dependent oxidoreductase n=1 Tax=Fischerella sp. JS2 TaxID=2597771 RepID=UPI0028E59296|nr:tryptophan halogenase [Fischerella sp. JS2]
MHSTQLPEYDVVVLGTGFAGNCQVRHLLLKIPDIRVALIDPRLQEDLEADFKPGESMIEIGTLFVCKELGLYDYVVENHLPRVGSNFHWPKDPTQTAIADDYYHIWCNRQPELDSTQINSARFEQDLLHMNQQMGADFFKGRVVDLDLTPGNALKTVKVQLDNKNIELKAKHIIDSAGRKFLVGQKTHNLLFKPENLDGVNVGSAWVHVKNVDRNIFHNGYDPYSATCSHYYATNHWFGYGHWLWMIPTDKYTQEISIGVIHHHDVIPASDINTQEKFYAFLKANHTNLYKLLSSGENVDFHYLPNITYTSKVMFSPDNWYVLGDAACCFDIFYASGTTMISFSIESITEIIRAKLADESNAEEKRSTYNDFCIAYAHQVNYQMKHRAQQLGHASIMSWRIYLEHMWLFGLTLPIYVGKWFLDPEYIRTYLSQVPSVQRVISEVYEQFNKLVEQGANIGLMDIYRADQLFGDYTPVKPQDDYLENAKFEPKHCNVFASLKHTYFYTAIWYILFQWKGFGLLGVLAPRHLYNFFSLWKGVLDATARERAYWQHMKHIPTNSEVVQMRQEFKNYRYQAQLQPR